MQRKDILCGAHNGGGGRRKGEQGANGQRVDQTQLPATDWANKRRPTAAIQVLGHDRALTGPLLRDTKPSAASQCHILRRPPNPPQGSGYKDWPFKSPQWISAVNGPTEPSECCKHRYK